MPSPLGRVLVVLLLAGCAASPPARGRDRDVEALADRLMEAARRHEVAVTRLLKSTAAEVGGTMVRLKTRFKARPSLVRKIHKKLRDRPERRLADVVIYDALRYTMRLDDEPPGRHVAGVRRALRALEAAGHRVLRVKNYWPRGDNYSGINTVIAAPDGFQWELQFHTTASLATTSADHKLYEELRLAGTPLARKRELFDRMARAWDRVPIPRDVLKPRSLHPAEAILRFEPPR